MEVNEIVEEDMRSSQFAEDFLLKLLFLVKAERFWYGAHIEENTGGKRVTSIPKFLLPSPALWT